MMDEEAFRQGCDELADAIAQGKGTFAEITGTYFKCDPETGFITGTCALGSAYLAKCGQRRVKPDSLMMIDLFPVLRERVYWPRDETGQRIPPRSLLETIILLNDTVLWSQTQIIAWVRKAKHVEDRQHE